MPGPLLIRADCSPEIGSGHFMRCLALAAEWKARGGPVTFLGRCENRAIGERIARAGIGLEPLEHDPGGRTDLISTLKVAAGAGAEWVVVDGRAFDAGYVSAVRAAGNRLLVIDDEAALPHYDADIVLNQNFGAETLEYSTPPGTSVLLGPRHALLRAEFRTGRRPDADGVRRLARRFLVTFGGGDAENVTVRVVRALRRAPIDRLEAVVVLGPLNPHPHAVLLERELTAGGGGDIRIVSGTEDMAALMLWCDMAVSAAGSTILELAHMGVPTLLVVVADNQVRGAEAMARAGAAVNLGRPASIQPDALADRVAELASDRDWRTRASQTGRRLVAGDGALRVVDALIEHRQPVGHGGS